MGSLFKSPKAPAPTDVAGVTKQANTQNLSNAFTNASFNRVNQRDQFGNTLDWSQDGTDSAGNPIFRATQGLGETGQMYAGGFADLGRQYFDAAGSRPDMGSGAAFDRAYGYASANLEPRMQRQADGLENKLRNQGLDPTSEAYKSGMNDLALQHNEARNNLVTNLQGQMFTQGLQDRQQQMSELQPGLQFGQTAMSPNYVQTPHVGVQNVDVAGLNAQNQADQWKKYDGQVAQRNAMMGGLAAIGGTILGGPMGGAMAQSIFGGGTAGGMPKAGTNSMSGKQY